MAVEAISSPKAAYQGSVPKADVPVSSESAKKVPQINAPAAGRVSENVISTTEQKAKDKTEPENTAQQKEAAKPAEKNTGTEAMRRAVDEINRHMKNSEIVFGIHDKTNRVTIKLVDKDSKKVLREYPPEQNLDTIAKIWELAGIMVDEKG